MKNFSNLFFALLMLAVLGGCGGSGWNQDPLAGKDDAFKNAKPRPTLPEAPKPVESDAVRVDTVDFYNFIEGVSGEFVIGARILEPGYAVKILVENLADFPGASFDETAGKFAWTPEVGTVATQNGLQEERTLKVQVVGEKPGAAVLVGSHSIPVRISKLVSEPVIIEVSKPDASLREGESTTLTVRVRDMDAGADPSSYPDLQILPAAGFGNLAHFVTLTRMFKTGANEFVFNLTVDLTEAELTKNWDRYAFVVRALSRFQKVSKTERVMVSVVTSFAKLQSTWFDTFEIPAGVRKDFQFMFFDPKEELYLESPVFSGVPTGASLNCRGVRITHQFCQFAWAPPANMSSGVIRIKAKVVSRNQSQLDNERKMQEFELPILITPAPTPTPTPTPANPAKLAPILGGR